MCAERTQRDQVSALANGLRAIEAFSASRPRMTLSDIARRAKLSRAAARRYLLTLEAAGYAETDGKHFRLTPRVLRLGYAYLSSIPLPQVAQPIIDAVGEQAEEAAALAVLDGTESIIIVSSIQRRIVGVFTRVGTHLPAFTSATGRVLLADKPDDVLSQKLRSAGTLRKLTPKTITSPSEILAEIGRVRQQGFSLNDEEIEIGLRVISVPVRNRLGNVVAALAISVHSARLEVRELKRKFFSMLVQSSEELGAKL
jgi:IclR family transcriptional regulator, pca regulon regulatory protein